MPYKNSEKRKEKSRDAARCRRGKESEVFGELADCLPMPASVISQLDKASIMRLSISYLKMQQILGHHTWTDEEDKRGIEEELDQLFPKALDGFVFILSREGDIVYINETVVKYLGIQQIELMGQSIFDFCDPRDEDEIREAVSVRTHGNKLMLSEEEDRVFFLRMKCTLTSKGRNVNLKSASYKVIRCSGQLIVPPDVHQAGSFPYLLAMGEPIPHPANIEVPMDSHTFLSKHDMNMKFTYCDDRVKELLNYNGEDLVGSSLFDYHHAMDSDVVEKAYKDLLSKGQTMTGRYRFMAQGGGWAWVITQATVIHNSRNKAQWIVCVHYVLTQVEELDLILSEVQKKRTCQEIARPCMESIFSPKPADVEDSYYVTPWVNEVEKEGTNEADHLTFLRSPCAGGVGQHLSMVQPRLQDGNNNYQYDNNQFKGREKETGMTLPSPAILEGLKQEPGLSPSFCHVQDMHMRSNLSPASSNSPCSSSASSRMGSPRDYGTVLNAHIMDGMNEFFHTLDMKCGPMKQEDFDVQRLGTDRAPSTEGSPPVPMDPASKDSLLTFQNPINPGLQGKTDNIFRSHTDSIFEEPPPPPRPSIRDMMGGSPTVASIEQPPDIMFKQIKRPLDMNSLEKGPPLTKRSRMVGQLPQFPQVPSMRSQKTLLSMLLMNGADTCDYSTAPSGLVAAPPKGNMCEEAINPLLCLTQNDCEVNAPIQSGPLLNGDDLLSALETVLQQIR